MAKVLLINPMYDFEKSKNYASMPLGLITLGTVIKEKEHEIKILDREIDRDDNYLIYLLKRFYPDIVGITAAVGKNLLDLMKIAKIVKENSNAIVIIGGVLPTEAPQPFLDYKSIDYVVRGEGEVPLLEMCELVEKGKKDFSKILNVNYNKIRPFINLNDFPHPDYSLIKLKKYPFFSFTTSRGCYGKCTFCYNNYYWGRLNRSCLRFYNSKKTIEMITEAVDKYKIKDFTIVDDNFMNLSRRSAEICNALAKYNIMFQCQFRTDCAQDETMRLLKKAGCYAVMFGFESGSQRVLDFLKKGTTIKQNINAIQICKKNDIFVDGSFMVGLPTETLQEMRETVNFIKKYPISTATVKKYTPFPGTELFEYCLKNKLVEKNPTTLLDYSLYEMSSPYPNVSEIPNEILFKVIDELNKKSFNIYFQKIIYLLRRRQYFYLAHGILRNVNEKIKGER